MKPLKRLEGMEGKSAKVEKSIKVNEAMIASIVNSVMFFTTARHARHLGIAYIISEQNLTLDLLSDGSAKVSDMITYHSYHADTFHHTLHLLDYNISQLTVSLFDSKAQTKQILRQTEANVPLSYQLTKKMDEALRLQLNYPSQHQTVSFVFEYVIDNIVTSYADLAELTPLLTQDSLIQEEADFNGTLLLPAVPQAQGKMLGDDDTKNRVPEENYTYAIHPPHTAPQEKVTAQLIKTGDQAQVSIDKWEGRSIIRVGLPSTAMTNETALMIQVAPEYFPNNPNTFPQQTLNNTYSAD